MFGGGGGIGVSVQLPKDFTWKDRTMPVTLTLKGHKTEPRHVEEIELELRSDEPQSEASDRSAVYHKWLADDLVDLAPGAEETFTIDMPLPFDLEAIEAAKPQLGADAPVSQRILGSLVSGAMAPPEHIRTYVVTARLRVEGSRVRASASKKIRYGGAFEAGRATFTFRG